MILAQFDFSSFMTPDNAMKALRLVITVCVGFPFSYFLSVVVAKSMSKRLTPQSDMLLRKAIFYIGATLVILSVLNQLGFKLTALLGAAGIIGIALGFASQTSVSNIISGIFLISEQPFQVGDLVEVSGTTGIVLSVDLLSVKLRTFDNKYVRIPNEFLIKNLVTNFTHFPIRRLDINLGVAYKEDIQRVQDILKDIAANNIYCLDEPEPLTIFTNFGNSALEILFAVWAVKTDFLKLKQSIMKDIKERFDAEGIEIPFPHITLYTGSETKPFPIDMQRKKSD